MNFESLRSLKTQPFLYGGAFLVVLLVLYLLFHTPPVNAPAPGDVATTTTEQATTTAVVPEEEFQTETKTVLMALDMKPWRWLSATDTSGTMVTPIKDEAFSIRFNASGAFSAETDCNSISGSYEARNGSLSLGSIASTKMFCEDSQEGKFIELLSRVETYRFVNNGQLVMTTSEGTEIKFR